MKFHLTSRGAIKFPGNLFLVSLAAAAFLGVRGVTASGGPESETGSETSAAASPIDASPITVTPIPALGAESESGIDAPLSSEVESDPVPPLERYEFLEEKMAVPVRLVFFAPTKELAESVRHAVYQRFDEINDIMSDYNPESELIRACQQSGENLQPVEIGDELYFVLNAARRVDRLSGGAFDVSVGPVVKLWRRSRSFQTRPPEPYLTEAKRLVGRENWELLGSGIQDRISEGVIGRRRDRYALRVLKKNVRLDLGGIAKGYAIDEGFRILREFGIRSALIDAGGDIRVGDAPPGKNGWTIGVASLAADGGAAFYMTAENASVATSGDSFQFIEIDGVRYSHLIDPRSGEPLTRHSIVSVLAPAATDADALASAVSVLGPEEGIPLIESLDGVEAIIFLESEDREGDPEREKTPEVFATGRFIQIKDDLLSQKNEGETGEK